MIQYHGFILVPIQGSINKHKRVSYIKRKQPGIITFPPPYRRASSSWRRSINSRSSLQILSQLACSSQNKKFFFQWLHKLQKFLSYLFGLERLQTFLDDFVTPSIQFFFGLPFPLSLLGYPIYCFFRKPLLFHFVHISITDHISLNFLVPNCVDR